jgi:hypothetical protein
MMASAVIDSAMAGRLSAIDLAAAGAAGLPQPESNRGYRPEQLITQFMLSIRMLAAATNCRHAAAVTVRRSATLPNRQH